MTIEALLLALVAGLGGGAGIVALLRVALPWARRVVPSWFAVGKALDASRDRLVASLSAEVTECTRQLALARAETLAERAEKEAALVRVNDCEEFARRLAAYQAGRDGLARQ